MSPDAPTLAFLLDSPLQSWGEGSRFNRRGSGTHPTKSGIVALLACARGLDKFSPDELTELAPLASLRLTTIRLPRIQYDRKRKPRLDGDDRIRFHRPSRMVDYHTLGGGFDRKQQPMRKPRKAAGGVFETVQTWREYLLDIRFAVMLQGDRDELERCASELRDPRRGLWLGRKSCPPATPILGEVHDSPSNAWIWITTKLGLPDDISPDDFDRYEELPRTGEDPDLTIYDQPVSFSRREFHARPVRHHRPSS